MSVHVFRAITQPATRFVDRNGPRNVWFRNPPHRTLFATCCHKRRWAKYLRAQVYYDGLYFWCAEGHGCKTEAQ